MQEPAHGLPTDDSPRDPDLIILVYISRPGGRGGHSL